MANCIEADNAIRLDAVEEKVDKLEKFLFMPGEQRIPERICDKCNGKGTFVDDGIL